MASFDIQPFASTNPAVGQLFGLEFAQRQAQRQADAQAAANEIARQQVAAQSQLAQAQLRGQQQSYDQANLFRMQELSSREKAEAERNRLFGEQLKVDKAYKEALAGGGARTAVDEERRKQAIIDANANANNDAQRANALFQINFDSAIAAAKKNVASVGAGLFGGPTVANYDDPKNPLRRAIQKQSFDAVRSQLLAEKGGALNSLIPDPDTFTFKPVQFDDKGNVVTAPFKAPVGSVGSGFDYMGNPVNPAALGTPPKTGFDDSGNAAAPGGTIANPAALGPEASAIAQVGQPIVNSVLSSAADMFGIKAPAVAPQMIQVPIDDAHFLEMSDADAAEAERQLRSIPMEQRPAAAAAIRDNLMKSGRARIRVRIPPMHEVLRNTTFN